MAHRRMTAAGNKALSLVGKSCRRGYCLAECVRTVYNIPQPYRWGGNGKPWAINYWFSAKSRGKVVQTSDPKNIPFGAMIFWDSPSNKPEHVAISVGGGYCVSTDYPRTSRWGKAKISSISSAWGLKLVGYILVTGDKADLRDLKKFTDPKDPRAYYIGAEGAYITTLGKNLVKKGFGKHYKSGPGPVFGEADRLNVRDCQLALGFKGDDADGFPGVTTLTFLASADQKIVLQAEVPPAPAEQM